jgi:shikimate dehydrogenase
MFTIGLIGKSLQHSFSQSYFTKKFKELHLEKEWQYLNFEIPSLAHVSSIIEQHHPIGFNVTVPYKETILPYLFELDESAEKIGAINTVKVMYEHDSTFKLKGYNTDAFGFHQLIKPFLELHHERALILGNGGAAKAVHYVLKNYGIDVLFAVRQPTASNHLSFEEVNEYVLKHHLLIVNCTPIGMFPETDSLPLLPYEALSSKHLLIDLVYNPEVTAFLKKGNQYGATTLNGITMLHQQAEKAWEIFRTARLS